MMVCMMVCVLCVCAYVFDAAGSVLVGRGEALRRGPFGGRDRPRANVLPGKPLIRASDVIGTKSALAPQFWGWTAQRHSPHFLLRVLVSTILFVTKVYGYLTCSANCWAWGGVGVLRVCAD